MELLKDELQDAAVRDLMVDPSDENVVMIVYDDDSCSVVVWNGTDWLTRDQVKGR
jgi:hypothetical protein